MTPSYDSFLASFAQRRMWYVVNQAGAASLYNMPLCWRVTGELDQRALETALQDLVDRHEALRTGFADDEGELIQHVYPHASLKLERLPMAASDEDARALRESFERRAFDLLHPPLMRAALVQLRETQQGVPRHDLLIVLHHLVGDGWSIAILLRELRESYRARRVGLQPDFAPLPIQYADYAMWQREWLQGAALEGQLRYWRDQLRDATPALELPVERTREAELIHRAGTCRVRLDAACSTRLRQNATRQGATLFMLLMAGWAITLARFSGQNNVCIGYPVAGRTRPELEGVVGLFVNTLVLRVEIKPNQTAEQLVREIRDAVLEADAHQDIPFDRVVDAIRPASDPRRSPLFQAFFAFYSADSGTPSMQFAIDDTLHVESHEVEPEAPKFELSLDLRTENGNVLGSIEYRADLLNAATVRTIAKAFQNVLTSIAETPSAQVESLALIDESERRSLVQRWQHSSPAEQSFIPLHDAFHLHALNEPERDAVACGVAVLSYAQLDDRVCHTSAMLSDKGVTVGTSVAIGLERGIDYVVAVLATLKVGAVFMPLDMGSPPLRWREVIEDSGAGVVVTDVAHIEAFAEFAPQVIVIDEVTQNQAELSLARVIAPVDVAYCIYTSGSTGRPKGALNTHGGLANLAAWYFSERVATRPGERVLVASDVTFDLTQKSILATLAYGGTVVLPDGPVTDTAAVHDAILRHRPTRISCAPSALRAYDLPCTGSSLQTVVLGGEPIDAALCDRIRSCGLTLVNSYGPTECADISASFIARQGDVDAWRLLPLPIGVPIPGARLYLLDDQFEPVPQGAIGEIHIGGTGVGLGYVGQPGLTAARFVPDPFGPPGARMYRTGDLAYELSESLFVYRGRRDEQIKLQGVRIELGEVEAALRRAPGVHDAAAAIVSSGADERHLAGFVVMRDDEEFEISRLRRFMSQLLPKAFIPTRWACLDSLPLNRSGKLDRRELAHAIVAPGEVRNREPLTTPTEHLLGNIWCALLEISEVGRQDNFFEIGGNSLLAMTMASHVRRASGANISVSDCLNAESLADLASQVDSLANDRGFLSHESDVNVPISKESTSP